MTFREVCRKQVIQTVSGQCLGHVDDVVFDPETKNVECFVMYGRPRLFGLLGRDEGLTIPIGEVARFGVDALLVTTPAPPQQAESIRWRLPWEK